MLDNIIYMVDDALVSALLMTLMVSGKRHIARKPFAFFLGFMALWGAFIFLMRFSPTLEAALFWEKFVFWAILSASLVFYKFTLALTGSPQKRAVLYPLYLAYIVFIVLLPTDFIVSGMQMMWYGKAPIVGPLFFLYVLCVYVPLIFGMVVLVRHLKHSRIIDERTRDQYIVAGIIAMFIGGTTDYLPPLGINMYPLGIIGNILFCMLATVAMLKYGLFELRVVLRKGATYSLVSMITFGIFGSIIFVLSSVFQGLMKPLSMVIASGVVFILAAAFQPILSKMQGVVDRWFFRERYDHIQTLKRFSNETKGYFDLEQLASSLVTSVANGLQSSSVYLLLPSPANGRFVTYSYCGKKNKERITFSAAAKRTKSESPFPKTAPSW